MLRTIGPADARSTGGKCGRPLWDSARVRMSALVVVLIAGVAGTAPPGLGQEKNSPCMAPMNPAFVDYFNPTSATRIITQTANGHALGFIPPPIDLPHVAAHALSSDARALVGLPTSYDLRKLGKLPPVRDQRDCGSCWAFAAIGSLESCLLPTESWDFSENHLKDTHGFDPDCCDGGNDIMATAYLARWSGPIEEASDPYNTGSCTSPTGMPVRKHVQQVDFLPARADALDNNSIKQAVMANGAVAISMYWDDIYYKSSTHSYCCGGASRSNHGVCVVGWDDNYDRSNFTFQPAGDGAFIVRNSWGSSWGENGYFYMSYYDPNLTSATVYKRAAANDNYTRIYQYDWLGWISSVGYYMWSNTAWFANVFTAGSDDMVMAASWYSAMPNSSYELYVYLDPGATPATGSPVAVKKGTLASAGYQTVTLDSGVRVLAGHRFSVVVKNTTPDYGYPIPFEYAYPGYSDAATAHPGESYMSSDGVVWTDMTNYYPTGNVCLKAFALRNPYLQVTPSDGLSSIGCTGGGSFVPSGQSYTLTNAGDLPLTWTAAKTQPWFDLSSTSGTLSKGASTTVTATLNSNPSYMGPGSYADTIAFTNTSNDLGDTTRAVSLQIVPDYEVRSTGYGWIDPGAHAALTLTDDGVSPAQTIPFTFTFYGKTYNQVYVGANGLIGFVNSGLGNAANTDIPSAAVPNATIYPYWDDLNPAGGGSVRVGTVGDAPNRQVVISWVGVPHHSSPSTTLTFQAILRESTNDIVFQYLQVQPGNASYGAGRSATIGVEHDSGTIASKYSFNGSKLLANGQALLFTNYHHMSISSAKRYLSDLQVALDQGIVSDVLGANAFYVESADRVAGIEVNKSSHGMTAGAIVDVEGVMKADSASQRYIQATMITRTGTGSVKPLMLSGRTLGGADWNYDPITGRGQKGVKDRRFVMTNGVWTPVVKDSVGLNNLGLLVSTFGRVTYIGPGYFLLDDGSGAQDIPGYAGMRVYCSGLTYPTVNQFLKVTGISTCYPSGSDLYRMLRVCNQSEMVVMR